MDSRYEGVIKRYREYLPVSENTPIVTLYEGNTPLIEAKNLKQKFLPRSEIKIYLKCEGFNPTGSFKDRGMTVAISKAKEENAEAVICASTGNTAASAAAYAARANLKCIVLVPSGAIALGKLSQALIHGSKVIAVDGNFDVALKLVREIVSRYPITLVNSINPYRIEGQKTAAFEIIDDLGGVPDYQFMPVGNAGNITAYWKGYKEYVSRKRLGKLPRMMGFQAAGAAPLVVGHPVENPQTIATAIRIGKPASWEKAIAARDESGGVIDTVTDDEILEAYYLLASLEGIFVEPASAASVAGLIKYIRAGYFSEMQRRGVQVDIVCILTGHGLKDPDIAISTAEKIYKTKHVAPNIDEIRKHIED
jgi:threonine synthase